MNNKKTILVSGSLVYDRIMDFPGYFRDHIMPDKIHILNVSFAVNNMRESFGGTAGNIAYNLSLLGERPKILASAGDDFAPYKKWLIKNKIDVSGVKIIKNENTASCHIITDKADNQITGFHGAAMYHSNVIASGAASAERGDLGKKRELSLLNNLTRNRLTEIASSSQGGTPRNDNTFYQDGVLAIISPGNIKDMENYARIYKKNKIKYIFDPGQAITALSQNALKSGINGTEILIGNDYEIGLIIKNTGWTTNEIIDKVGILVLTMGDKGSLIYNKNKKHIIKPVKVKRAIDPTGAGDAYRAGLIKGLVNGWNLEKCGRLASVVAGFAVEKKGTQEHYFSWSEVKKRYKSGYRESIK